jgi:putative protease
MSENFQPIGQVIHYFDRLGVAVIRLWEGLALGDWVHFYGAKTNFVQPVQSMQIDHQPYNQVFAEQGQEIEVAILVDDKVRNGDWVYPHSHEEGF